MRDTCLVQFLRYGGCSHGQAAAFERALLDRPICGVTVTHLENAIASKIYQEIDLVAHSLRNLELRAVTAEATLRDSNNQMLLFEKRLYEMDPLKYAECRGV